MVAYKCHPHNEIEFSFQVDLKLVVAILSRLQVVKVFSTTSRAFALKCHRVNEIIIKNKSLSKLNNSCFSLNHICVSSRFAKSVSSETRSFLT